MAVPVPFSRFALGALGCVVVAALAAGQEPPPKPTEGKAGITIDRLSWSKSVDGEAAVRVLEVRNDFGDVRARLTEDRTAEAWGVVQRLDRGGAGVGWTVERRGDVVALTVTYPQGRVKDDDPDPPKDSYDRLDLTVFVPQGVRLEATTLRGMVEARGLKSDVSARTAKGSIFVSATGAIRARTASGPVQVLPKPSPGQATSIVESESGPVTVTLPPDAAVRYRAETSGSLLAELKGKRTVEAGRTLFEGNVGRGGPTLLVVSTSGQVEIRTAR